MKKVVIPSAGGYDKLWIIEAPIPKPSKGEILIRTHAVGVNYADVCVRMGLYESAKKYVGWPITPGFEFAGTIEEIGEEDEAFEEEFKKKGLKVGSKVFGVTRFFAYATHVVVPKNQILPLPSNLSMEEAAGFPAVFLTAYYGMFELAHPRRGSTILVHSAAGGVGSALVQLGKVSGLKVVGVVGSSHKVAILKQLGCQHIIDKSKENLWEKAEEYAPEGYDVIFDANGVETLSLSYKHLASGGKLVVYGFHSMLPRTGGKPNWLKLAWDWIWTPSFNPLSMTGENKSVLAFNLSYLFHRVDIFQEKMENLLKMVEDGSIVSPKVTTYSFDDVVQSHKDIESGQTVGKLVLLTQ